MSITSLLIFAGALLVAAGSPGPSIAALVARVMTRGLSGVFPFLLAMWIGEAIWLSLAVFGLAYVAQTFHVAFVVLKWAGVAYLVFLAWKMWTAPVAVGEGDMPRADSPLRLCFAGRAVTLGNPKIMMFYLALLPTIIDLATVTLTGWAELTLTMVAVLVAIDLGWALAAVQARKLLKSPRAVRIAKMCMRDRGWVWRDGSRDTRCTAGSRSPAQPARRPPLGPRPAPPPATAQPAVPTAHKAPDAPQRQRAPPAPSSPARQRVAPATNFPDSETVRRSRRRCLSLSLIHI